MEGESMSFIETLMTAFSMAPFILLGLGLILFFLIPIYEKACESVVLRCLCLFFLQIVFFSLHAVLNLIVIFLKGVFFLIYGPIAFTANECLDKIRDVDHRTFHDWLYKWEIDLDKLARYLKGSFYDQ